MKYKKYPSYKNSGVEWVINSPSNWIKKPIKYVLKIQGGYAFKSELFSDKGIPIIRIGDIKAEIEWDKCKKINNSEVPEIAFKVCKNDTLIALSGATTGKTCYIMKKPELSYINQRVARLGYKNKFIYYVLNSDSFQKDIMLSADGSAQENISNNQIENMVLNFPPLQEQQKIANFLDNATAKIDTLIEKQTKLCELLKEKRQALISHAVTKGINPDIKMKDSGVEWLGEIPEHWQTNKLRYIFKFSTGLNITRANLQEKGIPCVSYGEIHSKYGFEVSVEKNVLKCVDESYLINSKNSLISKGDFIFADTSEDLEGAGNFTHLSGDIQVFAGYHTVIARLISENNYYRFIAYLLDSQSFRKQIRLAVKGVKVFSITQAILKNSISWTPSKKEQQQIANYLDDKTSKIDTLIEKSKQSIKLLKEKRTALISAAVTGKIDVREVV